MPTHDPSFSPVLCHDAVEVLGPCRPAKLTIRVIVTVLVAQHRGLAGRVGAGGVAGIVAAGNQVAFHQEPPFASHLMNPIQ